MKIENSQTHEGFMIGFNSSSNAPKKCIFILFVVSTTYLLFGFIYTRFIRARAKGNSRNTSDCIACGLCEAMCPF